MKHATWIAPRSAITVFRSLLFDFGEVSLKRHTLISRTLSRLGCPPAISSSPGPVPWEAGRHFSTTEMSGSVCRSEFLSQQMATLYHKFAYACAHTTLSIARRSGVDQSARRRRRAMMRRTRPLHNGFTRRLFNGAQICRKPRTDRRLRFASKHAKDIRERIRKRIRRSFLGRRLDISASCFGRLKLVFDSPI